LGELVVGAGGFGVDAVLFGFELVEGDGFGVVGLEEFVAWTR